MHERGQRDAYEDCGPVARESLKAIADRLRERYGAERVLVYGSVARSTPTEHSDIDLLIVAPTKERFYERMGSVLAAVRDISLGLPLAPIVLTPEELSDRLARGDQFIQEIVQTGVEL
jgi:predicted nucleotidyltransferase